MHKIHSPDDVLADRRKHLLREVKLTPEGWVFLVVLAFITVGAVLRNVNLLVVMAGMMYVSLLINWRLAVHRLKTLTAKRRLPLKLHANQLYNFPWSCQNNSRRISAWNVIVSDRIDRMSNDDLDEDLSSRLVPKKRFWTNSLLVFWLSEVFERVRRRKHVAVSEVEVCFASIGVNQADVQSYRVYFGQRGKYVVGPASLTTTFPFGLIFSRIRYREIAPFYVGPALGRLEPTWEKRVQSIAVGSEAIKRSRAEEEDEFYALRPWRSGDSKKNIHWRSTAKTGVPVIKQFDQQNNRDFCLVLDLYSESEEDAIRCELAISFAATALFDIKRDVQGKITLGICGGESIVCSSRSQQGIVTEAIRNLAVAQTTGSPEIELMIGKVAGQTSRGTPVYVVSSRRKPDILDGEILGERIKSLTQSNPVAREELRALRSLKQFIPFVRWINVESDEFRGMFSLEGKSNEDELKELVLKLGKKVSR